MTSLPDWLVERAALEEVAPASRARLDAADPAELATRIAALNADNAAELAAYPARPAVAQIDQRIAAARRRRRVMLGAVSTVAALALAILVLRPTARPPIPEDAPEITRAKGGTRLLAFRLAGDHVEKLDPDALAHPGDVIQLRYNPGGQRYGLIASIDGAGAVTLHYPPSEDASPVLAAKTTALATAYELDDAPRFERFFFITDSQPFDVKRTLDALRELARHDDADAAWLELPDGMRQQSLRLRKPDRAPKDPQ